MWSPQICLFLVVTARLVCAAPTAKQTKHTDESESVKQHLVNVESAGLTVKQRASVDSPDSTVKRSARIDSFLAIPSTGFTCSAQPVPGIYADQETGCQVFHYCQDGGRMDSFFCPNLTLFNQQYFVCDWSYNVDCDSSHLYFSLNEALYKTPEIISQAISPAIKFVENEYLQGAASSEVSRTLNSLVSQLDSRSSAIVVDSTSSPAFLAQSIKTNQFSETKSDRTSKSLTEIIDSKLVDTKRTGKSLDSGPSTYGDNIIPSYNVKTTIKVETPIATVTASPVTENAAISSIVKASQSSYYDDSADPEPTDINGSLTTYDSSAADSVLPVDAYNSDSSFDANNSETSAVAYNSASGANSNYVASVDNTYDDAIADPEPAGYYSRNSVVANSGSTDNIGIGGSNYGSQNQGVLPSYEDAVSNVYDPYDSADPEPSAIPYSTSGSYNQYDTVKDTVKDVYEPYDSADIKPALPYPSSDSYGQYDSADPEPDSYYGYYDSADPEPASYYGANTIDLSSDPLSSYQPSSASQYSNIDTAKSLTVDYDDASADPEPDPSSYGSEANLYDSSVVDYQQPSYKSLTPTNPINDYYKGYPSQGLVVDSPDPEPSADPEFTPYADS